MGTFTLANPDGVPFSASGTIVEEVFAIHLSPSVDGFRVSHLPTGAIVGRDFDTEGDALIYVNNLALDPVWRSKHWKFGKRYSLKSKLMLAASASVRRAMEATKP